MKSDNPTLVIVAVQKIQTSLDLKVNSIVPQYHAGSPTN
jgi:hypothetical protein